MGTAAKVGRWARSGIPWSGPAGTARGGASPLPPMLAWLAALPALYAAAMSKEADARRPFLWIPVTAGAGAVLGLTAERDPSLPAVLIAFGLASLLAWRLRARPVLFAFAVGLAALMGGLATSGLRVAFVEAPVLDRLRIAEVTGFVEELDPRAIGARMLVRVRAIDGLAAEQTPYRVRVTLRTAPRIAAGDFVRMKARLLPPSRAALPGGYDFARDAFFVRLGAVGNVLGSVKAETAAEPAPLGLRLHAAIDRARNALAERIVKILPGPAGAVAVAMVTGKRDRLEEPTKETIRAAGIFHIITISGVQMTLVAGILFTLLRGGLALSRTLALRYPIKQWAAVGALAGAIAYDIGTGSRVGTERALYMTAILLGAAIVGRRAFSMRNLALAALMVVIFEPEALLGASFQLSFAAVAALIAVWEGRSAVRHDPAARLQPQRGDRLLALLSRLRDAPGHALFSTLCATSATASFMAADFHELSPWVMIGNPLTLIIIELFAVPAALLGTLLAPLGLDGPVWSWLGMGIDFVLWAAGWIGSLPGATIHLPAFSWWALPALALGVLSAVLWRTTAWRLTAVPLLALGLMGATMGERRDLYVAPLGDAMALRAADGRLTVVGRRPSLFAVEQWLRADADGRPARAALAAGKPGQGDEQARCDALGCRIEGPAGVVALVLDPRGFLEDCARADVIVTPLVAPAGCGALAVYDRVALARTGAVAASLDDGNVRMAAARGADEDRPWSRAPRPRTDWQEFDDARAADSENGDEEKPLR